jgi:hypothetical protein
MCFIPPQTQTPVTIVKDDGSASVVPKCEVCCQGVKIFSAVFADDKTSIVRCSVVPEKSKDFEKVVKPLFNGFSKLGKYDSGNIGYEFTVPNLEIKIFQSP